MREEIFESSNSPKASCFEMKELVELRDREEGERGALENEEECFPRGNMNR